MMNERWMLDACGCHAAQVFFVGSDAKIDMRPSSLWLQEKTAKWPWKTHLKVLHPMLHILPGAYCSGVPGQMPACCCCMHALLSATMVHRMLNS